MKNKIQCGFCGEDVELQGSFDRKNWASSSLSNDQKLDPEVMFSYFLYFRIMHKCKKKTPKKVRIIDCQGHVAEHKGKIGDVQGFNEFGNLYVTIDDGNSLGVMTCYPTEYVYEKKARAYAEKKTPKKANYWENYLKSIEFPPTPRLMKMTTTSFDKKREKLMQKIIDSQYAEIKNCKVIKLPFGTLIWKPRS